MKNFFYHLFALTFHYTYAFVRWCSIKVHSRYTFLHYHDVGVGVAIMLYPLSELQQLSLSQKEFIFHKKMPQTSFVKIFSRAKSQTAITGFSSVDNKPV